MDLVIKKQVSFDIDAGNDLDKKPKPYSNPWDMLGRNQHDYQAALNKPSKESLEVDPFSENKLSGMH